MNEARRQALMDDSMAKGRNTRDQFTGRFIISQTKVTGALAVDMRRRSDYVVFTIVGNHGSTFPRHICGNGSVPPWQMNRKPLRLSLARSASCWRR